MCYSATKARSRNDGETIGQPNMEWEEALLRARGGDAPPSAAYFRRKAARVRQTAEGVTTRAIKARLLEEAVHWDRLAADADRGVTGEEDADFETR